MFDAVGQLIKARRKQGTETFLPVDQGFDVKSILCCFLSLGKRAVDQHQAVIQILQHSTLEVVAQ